MATVRNDLLDRIRKLETQVRELAGRSQTRPPLDQIKNGDVRITEGGQLAVTPPDKPFATFTVGEWPDGAYGLVARRMDGSYALTVEGEDDDRGTVRIWSRDTAEPDRILLMDDKHSPRHLGRPWLPLQLHPTANQHTTDTAWAHAWVGISPVHNPVAHLQLTSYAEAGGRVRVLMRAQGGEAEVIDEWEVPAGKWTAHTVERPLHRAGFLDDVAIQIEHQSAKKRKAIETRLLSAYSRNTVKATEAPEAPAGREGDTGKPDPTLPVETDDEHQEHEADHDKVGAGKRDQAQH
ncbi:hypothetical protein [Streptomyces nigrescens]|uniref:hypothetical protein n=1 Tax=Streptomyces nigrescens TaxID=1920 RepID=UPI0022586F85|nr:hypothetical protein [Streptomyces libani]MCX5446011.1 hypothetical protein [Streptomyces libani]